MKNILVVIAILLFGGSLSSQNSYQGLTDEFFKKYVADTDQAFDYLFGTNPWMGATNEGVQNVKLQIREYTTLMGGYISYEKIGEKELGESLSISIYLVKYERQPLRFVFKFYKPRDQWMIYNFSFDENVDDDLEEIMKSNYLNK